MAFVRARPLFDKAKKADEQGSNKHGCQARSGRAPHHKDISSFVLLQDDACGIVGAEEGRESSSPLTVLCDV